MLLLGVGLFLVISLWFPSTKGRMQDPEVTSSLRSGQPALGWGLGSPHRDLALLMTLGKSRP